MWSKHITRKVTPHTVAVWNASLGRHMENLYGIAIWDTITIGNARSTEYYVNSEERGCYWGALRDLLSDGNRAWVAHAEAQTCFDRAVETARGLGEANGCGRANDELANWYETSVLPFLREFYSHMWFVFHAGEILPELASRILAQGAEFRSDLNGRILSVMNASTPSESLRQRMALLRLAKASRGLNNARFEAAVRAHARKYAHVPMFDFDHEPYGVAWVKGQIDQVDDPAAELREFERAQRHRKEELEEAMGVFGKVHAAQRVIELLQQNIWLRDYRDTVRQKVNLGLRRLFEVVGTRVGMQLSEVARLAPWEVAGALRGNMVTGIGEQDRRSRAWLLMQKREEITFLSGQEAVTHARDIVAGHAPRRVNVVSGVVASRGRAEGRARIVYSGEEAARVCKGEVMVAPMIRPDFVPGLMAACALVTDEGGVTCHAAIIARELGIPCVVSTEAATAQIADGDWIEVDAIEGTVRVRGVGKGE